MLYSSSTSVVEDHVEPADANTYRPFKVLDSTVMKSILDQMEVLNGAEQEGVFIFP